MTLHANTSTNVLYAGGTSSIESVGRAKVVARFRGTLANNKCTPSFGIS